MEKIIRCKNCVFFETHSTDELSYYFGLSTNFEWYRCAKHKIKVYPAGFCSWAVLDKEPHSEWSKNQIKNLKIAINDYYKNRSEK